jgi:hypothetical protein
VCVFGYCFVESLSTRVVDRAEVRCWWLSKADVGSRDSFFGYWNSGAEVWERLLVVGCNEHMKRASINSNSQLEQLDLSLRYNTGKQSTVTKVNSSRIKIRFRFDVVQLALQTAACEREEANKLEGEFVAVVVVCISFSSKARLLVP